PEPLRRPGGVEAPLGVGDRPLGVPEAEHLPHLLLQRHAREEVLHAPRRGERGVLVVRPRCPGLPPHRSDRQEGAEHPAARTALGFHQALGTEVAWSGTLPSHYGVERRASKGSSPPCRWQWPAPGPGLEWRGRRPRAGARGTNPCSSGEEGSTPCRLLWPPSRTRAGGSPARPCARR